MNGLKYVFVIGPVAVVVQHWEERFSELESGARVEVRRVEPSTGERNRPGAAGFRVLPVSEGGIWRADLFAVVDPPTSEPRYHHPRFADLPGLLTECGVADLAAAVDPGQVADALPSIRTAIHACLTS